MTWTFHGDNEENPGGTCTCYQNDGPGIQENRDLWMLTAIIINTSYNHRPGEMEKLAVRRWEASRRRGFMRIPRVLCMAGLGFAIFFAIHPLSASDLAQQRCGIVPNAWTPSLAEVQAYLEESSRAETTVTQQFLTQNSQNMADLRDAELFIVYVHLMQALAPPARTNLFKEQERWLRERSERARATVVSKGGTLEPFEYSNAYRSTTERRLSELRQLLRTATPQRHRRTRS